MGRFLTLGGVANAGFFGPAPVAAGGGGSTFQVPTISFGSTGPSFNGPGQTFYGAGTTGLHATPSGFTGGSVSPDPFSIGGAQLIAFGQFSTTPSVMFPTGLCFVLILSGGGLAQSLFTSLDFTLASGNHYTLTSAGAFFNNPWDDTATGSGYTTWAWNSSEGFFPPASFPNPITVNP